MPINKNSFSFLYIDTSIFIKYHYDLTHPDFKKLNILCKSNNIKQIYTDITQRELLHNFEKEIDILRNSSCKLLTGYKEKIIDKIRKDFNKKKSGYWKDKTKIEYDDIKLSNIMDSYFKFQAPFSTKKPNEFKDSVVLNAILEYAENHLAHSYIISTDYDWKDFSQLKYKSNFSEDMPNSILNEQGNSYSLTYFSNILEFIAYLEEVTNVYDKLEDFYCTISFDLECYVYSLYDNDLDFENKDEIEIRIYKKSDNSYEFSLVYTIYVYEIDPIYYSDIFKGMKGFNKSNYFIKELGISAIGGIIDNKIVNFKFDEVIHRDDGLQDLEELINKFLKKYKYYNNFKLSVFER